VQSFLPFILTKLSVSFPQRSHISIFPSPDDTIDVLLYIEEVSGNSGRWKVKEGASKKKIETEDYNKKMENKRAIKKWKIKGQ